MYIFYQGKKKEKEQNKKETEINELYFRGNMC